MLFSRYTSNEWILPSPGLKLQRSLFTRHLESMRIVVIGGFKHLHARNADPRAHGEPLTHKTELGHAVQQHVVKLKREQCRGFKMTAH